MAIPRLYDWVLTEGEKQHADTLLIAVERLPGFGRGCVATRGLLPGTEVLRLPLALALSVASMIALSPETQLMKKFLHMIEDKMPLPSEVNSSEYREAKYQRQVICLAALMSLDQTRLEPTFQHYYPCLPLKLDSPLFWSANDFNELDGQLLASLLRQKMHLLELWFEVVKPALDTLKLEVCHSN